MKMEKYQGIFPAFYACYDDNGDICPERTRALTRHLIKKGVKGLYVGGSSGECIYQGVAERKMVLENVMVEAKSKVTVIAHVACDKTAVSRMALQIIGTIFLRQHQTQISSFIIFRSWREWRLRRRSWPRCKKIPV